MIPGKVVKSSILYRIFYINEDLLNSPDIFHF